MINGFRCTTCEFVALDPETTLTIVTAMVDQMCAHADVDALLLDTIELPLVEAIDALIARSIRVEATTVSVDAERTLEVEFVAEPLGQLAPTDLLGSAYGLIESYFDLGIRVEPGRLVLRSLLT